MENKYYTPTIEEFHVGFNCYYKAILLDNTWTPVTISYEWMASLFDEIENMDLSLYRVKYLDREDIESLDWEYCPNYGIEENYGIMFTKRDPNYEGTLNMQLKYWFTNNRLNIYKPGCVVFDGTIKNKSELKILLKQLGIDEN